MMKAGIEKNKLFIEIDINEKPIPSESGKTFVIAATGYKRGTDIYINGEELQVSLSAYIHKRDENGNRIFVSKKRGKTRDENIK